MYLRDHLVKIVAEFFNSRLLQRGEEDAGRVFLEIQVFFISSRV